jgi:hypothetical protein
MPSCSAMARMPRGTPGSAEDVLEVERAALEQQGLAIDGGAAEHRPQPARTWP